MSALSASPPPLSAEDLRLLEAGLRELGFGSSPSGSGGDAETVPGTDGTDESFSAPCLRTLEEMVRLFALYIRELELFNAVFDLVGADTRQDLIVRHIFDSLSPWKTVSSLLSGTGTPSLADAGSGAGFPGIPLAIAFPDIPVTLIERMSKRCAFLENCAAMMGLRNVRVLNCEVEKAPRHSFSVLVFRAFRPLDTQMTGTLLGLLRSSGHLAAWKARRVKIDEEMAGIAHLAGSWTCVATPVPGLAEEERHVVVITGPTSSEVRPNRSN